jgi:hypothetical protein
MLYWLGFSVYKLLNTLLCTARCCVDQYPIHIQIHPIIIFFKQTTIFPKWNKWKWKFPSPITFPIDKISHNIIEYTKSWESRRLKGTGEMEKGTAFMTFIFIAQKVLWCDLFPSKKFKSKRKSTSKCFIWKSSNHSNVTISDL